MSIDKYEKLFQCTHGSHLYGLNTENSDVDFKGVFMPKMDELLLGKSPKHFNDSTGRPFEKNVAGDIDSTWYSLPEFIKLCSKGEMIAMDMLHATEEWTHFSSPEWRFIQRNRWRFYTKNMKAFLGYARKQASKYGIRGSRMASLEEVCHVVANYLILPMGQSAPKLCQIADELPLNDHCRFITAETKQGEEQEFYEVLGSKFQLTMPLAGFVSSVTAKWESYGARAKAAKENKGVDWKAVSHAIRAGFQLKEIYEDGAITYPLKERDLILDIKLGKKDFLTEVQPLLEQLLDEVEALASESRLPEKVNDSFWDGWLIDVYMSRISRLQY